MSLQKSNKLFLWLKILFTVAGLYFVVRVIYSTIVALISSAPFLDEFPNTLLFWAIFFIGLLHIVNLIEVAVIDQKKNYHLILLKTILVLVISFGFLKL